MDFMGFSEVGLFLYVSSETVSWWCMAFNFKEVQFLKFTWDVFRIPAV